MGPTGYGDSPYQSPSAFAGNPLLISPEQLQREGLLRADDLDRLPPSLPASVDYAQVMSYQGPLLGLAFENFKAGKGAGLKEAFDEFRHSQSGWLEDFSLFMALRQETGGLAWGDWPSGLQLRQAKSLQDALQRNASRVEAISFAQFLFFRQWDELKSLAGEHGVRIIGDAPIFVAHDSADVWAHPELFKLDERGRPLVVAGTPPDRFSRTGQLWGTPHYCWERMREDKYRWWIQRIRAVLRTCDLVRLDHFRGFEAAWEIPFGETTAEHGEWVPGPGAELFEALRAALGSLPVIAEDLGYITPAVESLRKQLGLPGMSVLQFAFQGDPASVHLPHNYEPDTVVYTATHDNDTTRGWYASAPEEERDLARRYLGSSGADITWDFIRLAWQSIAVMAVVPLQDVLDLGSEARMNFPGRSSGNWRWRVREEQLTPQRQERLADLTWLCRRKRADSQSGGALDLS